MITTYFGRGSVAKVAAALDQMARAERRLADGRHQAEEAAWLDMGQRLDEASRLIDLLAQGSLLADGYHQHDRGQWRRRRT